MRTLYHILLIAASVISVTLSSCSKMEETYENDMDRIIMFQPCLYSNYDFPKGTMIESTDYDYDELGPFWATAWDEGAFEPQFGYTMVKQFKYPSGSPYSGITYWSTVDEEGKLKEYYWKNPYGQSVCKYFFAYTNLPETGAVITNDNPDYQILTYSVPQKAENQRDILLGAGFGQGNLSQGNGFYQTITFQHCLCAVKFEPRIYEWDESLKESINEWDETRGDKITKIMISGVYSAGTCKRSTGSNSWTSSTGTMETFADDIRETFLLIPQSMTKTKPISVLVSFIYKGKTYSGVTSSISSGKWERGACYTYSMVVDFKNLTPDSDTKSSFSDLGGLTLELVSETAL